MTGQSAFLLGNTPRTPIHSASLHFRVGLKISDFDLKFPIVKRAGWQKASRAATMSSVPLFWLSLVFPI